MHARTSGRLKTELPRAHEPSRPASGVTLADARPSFTHDFSTDICMPTCAGRPLKQPPLVGSRKWKLTRPPRALRHRRRPAASRPAFASTGSSELRAPRARANPNFFLSSQALSTTLCASQTQRDDTRQEARWLGSAFSAKHAKKLERKKGEPRRARVKRKLVVQEPRESL